MFIPSVIRRRIAIVGFEGVTERGLGVEAANFADGFDWIVGIADEVHSALHAQVCNVFTIRDADVRFEVFTEIGGGDVRNGG